MLTTLRRNWYLIASVVSLLLAAFYAFYGQRLYPTSNGETVYYPLLMFIKSSAFPLAIVAFIAFLVLAYLTFSLFERRLRAFFSAILSPVFLGMAAAIGLILAVRVFGPASPFELIAFVVTCILYLAIVYFQSRGKQTPLFWRHFVTLGLVLFTGLLLVNPALRSRSLAEDQQTSIEFDGRIYRLIAGRQFSTECSHPYYVVYACDASGSTCSSAATPPSKDCYGLGASPIAANFVVDGDTLYAEVQGQRVYEVTPESNP